MRPDVVGPAPPGNRPVDQAATTLPDTPILQPVADNLPAFVVLLTTRHGMPRRRVYLDLGAARTVVQRAHDKGQEARLVLCELRAVTGDLGEWSG
jgi:hypothetical protein